jgi:hypothetical protein
LRLDNDFEVAAPAERVWDVLNDVPAVVPCVPGAELTETLGEDSWKALVHLTLGPIALDFDTTVVRQASDAVAHRVVLDATAREVRGRGGAKMTIESALAEHDGGTRVTIATDLTLKGAVAQFGRGVVPSVAAQLTREFSDNLAQLMQRAEPTSPAAAEESAKRASLSAARLALRTLRQAVHDLGARLSNRGARS